MSVSISNPSNVNYINQMLDNFNGMKIIFKRNKNRNENNSGFDLQEFKHLLDERFNTTRTTSRFGKTLGELLEVSVELNDKYVLRKLREKVVRSINANEPLEKQLYLLLTYIQSTYSIHRVWVLLYDRMKRRLRFMMGVVDDEGSTEFPTEIEQPESTERRPLWYCLFHRLSTANIKDIWEDERRGLVDAGMVLDSIHVDKFMIYPLWDNYGPVGVLILDNKTDNGTKPIPESIEEDDRIPALIDLFTRVLDNQRLKEDIVDRFGNIFSIIGTSTKRLTDSAKERLNDNEVKLLNIIVDNCDTGEQLLHQYFDGEGTSFADKVERLSLNNFMFKLVHSLRYSRKNVYLEVWGDLLSDNLIDENPSALYTLINGIITMSVSYADVKRIRIKYDQERLRLEFPYRMDEELYNRMMRLLEGKRETKDNRLLAAMDHGIKNTLGEISLKRLDDLVIVDVDWERDNHSFNGDK